MEAGARRRSPEYRGSFDIPLSVMLESASIQAAAAETIVVALDIRILFKRPN